MKPEGDYSRLQEVTEEWTEEVPMILIEEGGSLGRYDAIAIAAAKELGADRADVLAVRDEVTGEVLYDASRRLTVAVRRHSAQQQTPPSGRMNLEEYARLRENAMGLDT